MGRRTPHDQYIAALAEERWARWEHAIRAGDDRALGALTRVLEGMAKQQDRPPTPRELEVLSLFALGHTARSAGERLGIGRETVKSHLRNLVPKLDARNTTNAVAIAIRRRLI